MNLTLNIKYNNSAGRLLAILNAIKQTGNETYMDLFPKVFGNDDEEANNKLSAIQRLSITFDGIHELQTLYSHVVADIEKSSLAKEQVEVALRGILSVRGTINPANLQSKFRPISDAEAAMLEMCAAGLEKFADASDDELEELRKSAEDLFETAKRQDIDETLQRVILELARVSRTSIDLYEIRGPDGLRAAFKEMIGELSEILFTGTSEDQKEKIKKSDAWKEVCKHLQRFDMVASKLMQYKPLLEGGAQILIGS